MPMRVKESSPVSIGSTCRVIESGWYGLCFGSRSRRLVCQCTLSLVFHNKNDDHKEHNVPFEVDGVPVFSLEYGRLLYCKESNEIRLNFKSSCDFHKADPDDLQWRLVLRHASSVEASIGGELTEREKCIVCATCKMRTFAQVQAAESHYKAAHKIFPSDSIWKKPLEILYQDADFAVIDKPQGIPIQGGEGTNLMKSDLLLPLSDGEGEIIKKPIIVHRLDAPTGGLLILAKNKEAERNLKKSLAEQRFKKRYRAIVFGNIKAESGNIVEPVNGKTAETRYEVVRRTRCCDERANGWITTVDLYPISGRKHQIRRHLKHIGHPIWGDRRYARYVTKEASFSSKSCGLSEEDKIDLLHRVTVEEDSHARLCLWAMELCLPHPWTNVQVRVSLREDPVWLKSLESHQEKLYFSTVSQRGSKCEQIVNK